MKLLRAYHLAATCPLFDELFAFSVDGFRWSVRFLLVRRQRRTRCVRGASEHVPRDIAKPEEAGRSSVSQLDEPSDFPSRLLVLCGDTAAGFCDDSAHLLPLEGAGLGWWKSGQLPVESFRGMELHRNERQLPTSLSRSSLSLRPAEKRGFWRSYNRG